MVFVRRKNPEAVSPEGVRYALQIVGEGALGTIRVRNWNPLGSRSGMGVLGFSFLHNLYWRQPIRIYRKILRHC